MRLLIGITLGAALLGLTVFCDAKPDRPAEKKSPFAGNYEGTWEASTVQGKHKGGMKFSVDADGQMSGAESDQTSGTMANLAGAIRDDGDIAFTLRYPSGTYKVEGTISKTKDGELHATLIQYFSDGSLFAGYRIKMAPKK